MSNGEMLPFLPAIHVDADTMIDVNTNKCICFDLQHDDYSILYGWFNYLLIIIALPSLSFFGVVTNMLNVYIYSRKRMRNSANTYLLFLACSDSLVILTGLSIFWIDSARSYIPELKRAPYTTIYALPFGYMAQSCSIYFTVAAAFDCYVNVCCHSLRRRYCTVRVARSINTCIAILAVIYNSLRFPQFNLRKCIHDGSQEAVIEICPTTLFFLINKVYNVYLYMVLMTLLPFLILLILNVIIVYRQTTNNRKKQRKARSIRGQNSGSSSHCLNKAVVNGKIDSHSGSTMEVMTGSEDSADDPITMIMVVVLFLGCNTMALVVNIIETFLDPDPLLLNFLTDASNFLVIFNSSVNCLIYITFNKEYRAIAIGLLKAERKAFKNSLCHCSEKNEKNALMSNPQMNEETVESARSSDTVVNNGWKLNKNGNNCMSPVWRLIGARDDDDTIHSNHMCSTSSSLPAIHSAMTEDGCQTSARNDERNLRGTTFARRISRTKPPSCSVFGWERRKSTDRPPGPMNPQVMASYLDDPTAPLAVSEQLNNEMHFSVKMTEI
ncbi:hypothetical protein AB6A40_004424 [Gnathostoma spinigerum]|uniref:G-protein coupled receptors family 1 profile domain-containing protein n=1 Tax=Gnathostoma spinigerum TaxID=75299 RepID=A0ABD6EN53_9BILA